MATRLHGLYAPLFRKLPSPAVYRGPAATLVCLSLPVRRWKPDPMARDERGWVFASDYPVNARAALTARNIRAPAHAELTGLCRALQGDPQALLHELAPPFSLIWTDRDCGTTFVQNDGLGHAQLFEYQYRDNWVLSNRILALRALGLPVEPDPEQWAVRFALGWFPQDMTGFKWTRQLAPGTQLRLNPAGVRRSLADVLSGWVAPRRLSRDDCLEMARESIRDILAEAARRWEKPTVGLSGGWDSRVIVASLRALGEEFSLRVRGQPDRPDVLVASRLAKVAGLPLKIRHAGGMPPDSSEGCRRSICSALLWQAGHAGTRKHVTFMAGKRHLGAGGVNVMGSTGEICRGYYARKISALDGGTGRLQEDLLAILLQPARAFLRSDMREHARDVILTALRQAQEHGLAEDRWLDFFYLNERTRRWRCGAMNVQTGLVIAPFLNPRLIAATFSFPSRELPGHPFHKHIIATLAPDWADLPYAEELAHTVAAAPAAVSGTVDLWRRPRDNKTHDRQLHWDQVGRPLIREALAAPGFWSEIFDPVKAAGCWRADPDALAIAHLLPQALGDDTFGA